MNTILEKIVSVKREEVAQLKRIKPLTELREAIRDLPKPGNFDEALAAPSCAIIAEVKKQSPSRGIIRQDFDHRNIASMYQKSGAAAVSVLTDMEFFGGSGEYLTDIRKTVKLPILRKDFIIDSHQIYETRSMEADAMLLIAAILTIEELKDFIALSQTLGMSSLVEVHCREELDKALLAEADIIGINNRDLRTFSTDLKVSLNLAPHVPSDKILVSESGINNRQDIELLMTAGIHAFLIGEMLMRSGDISKTLQELLGGNR